MNKLALLLGTSILLTGIAHAEGFYVGGGAGIGDATLRSDAAFDDPDDKLFVARGIGGYRVSEFFAVEAALVGATNDEYDDGVDGEADVSFGAISASLVGIIPIDPSFELFAKAGVFTGESEVDDSFLFFSDDQEEDESGLVYGAGAFINFGSRNQFTIRLEYERYETDALDDLSAVGAAFLFNF